MSSETYISESERDKIDLILDQLFERRDKIANITLDDSRDVDIQAGVGERQQTITVKMKPQAIIKEPNPTLEP